VKDLIHLDVNKAPVYCIEHVILKVQREKVHIIISVVCNRWIP